MSVLFTSSRHLRLGCLPFIVGVGLITSCSQGPPSAMGEGPPPGVPAQLATVSTQPLETTSEFVGTLEARQSVPLRPEVNGYVKQLFVQAGDRVPAGKTVVLLSLDKQQAQLDREIAVLNAARAQRSSAIAALRALEAEKATAEAELALQRAEFDRIAQLVAEGALSQQSLDRVQRDRTKAEADLRAKQEQIAAAQARVAETEATLKQASAQVNLESERLRDTTVTAPFAGVIGDIPVRVGTYVESGDTLMTVTQNQILELRLPIPLERGPDLRLGLPVRMEDAQGKALGNGRITFISPQVNAESQTILAKASIDNPQDQLRDGQFVRARVIWDRQPSAIVIPSHAIVAQGTERLVYVAVPGEAEGTLIAKSQPIQVGQIQGDRTEVVQGLQVGTQIVVSGTQKLADGVPIMPLEPQ
ncbi:efflux RND transporter periplasmic adaptor subunit [Trichothermofontia sp.]